MFGCPVLNKAGTAHNPQAPNKEATILYRCIVSAKGPKGVLAATAPIQKVTCVFTDINKCLVGNGAGYRLSNILVAGECPSSFLWNLLCAVMGN